MTRIYVALCYLFTIHGVLSTVPAEADSTHSCNSCCQGPIGLAGVPGVPGAAGSNGLHGRDGFKGDAGMKGNRGDSGFPGPQGPAGSSGDPGLQGSRGFQGLPGKVGPRGLTGSPGVDGRSGAVGPVGPKGNRGDAPEVNKSAFAVYKTSTQSGSSGDVLTFQVAQTNIGSHFDMISNKFTCRMAGTYVFMFTISTNSYTRDPYTKLVKDGENVTGAHVNNANTVNSFLQSSNMAILQLTEGNQVWLQFGNSHDVYSHPSHKWTSFSGFLLYTE